MSAYYATSRPYIENCKWVVPRTDQEEGYYRHVNKIKGARRSFYKDNPEWIAPTPLPSRFYKEPYLIKGNLAPRDYYRKRIRDEIEKEDAIPRAHLTAAYQVKINSPYYINDPKEVRDQNRMLKVTRNPVDLVHLNAYNSAREVLYREVSLPPLDERYLPVMSRLHPKVDPFTPEEIHKLRFVHNNYLTYCDWGPE